MFQTRADSTPDLIAESLLTSEKRFLAQVPDFTRVLDESAVRTHLEKRMSAIGRVETPVPHLLVHDVFDAAFYRMLKAAWPPLEIFKRDKTGRKYDLVPSSQAAGPDSRSEGYSRLPDSLRSVWDFLVFTVNRKVVGPLLAKVFEPEIRQRVSDIRRAFDQGLIDYSMAGTRDWSYQANLGRFMVRGDGYELKPHVDSMPYLVTALHYFPDDDDDRFGTIFYKPQQPLEFDKCVRDGSTQYFDDPHASCEEVLRIPFRANTLLAFPNSLSAAHGAVAPVRGRRKVFQYHLSLKSDHEKV